MNIRQLRYISTMLKSDLNVSTTAEKLFTSQPGVSKQIRLLEEELDTELFLRSGKKMVGITHAGEAIIELADEILTKIEHIRSIAKDFSHPSEGHLSIATTHTQARYVLPEIIRRFSQKHPKIQLEIHQGTPPQIAQMAEGGDADIAIATEVMEQHFKGLYTLPCYQWNRCVITPREHPLSAVKDPLTLEQIAAYPIITYVAGFTGRALVDRAFHHKGLRPNLVITAADADVIKTYVRLGLGIGLVARMAYEEKHDGDLLAFDASHLFAPSITRLGFRKELRLRPYMYDFIKILAPHLTEQTIQPILQRYNDSTWRRQQLAALKLPCY